MYAPPAASAPDSRLASELTASPVVEFKSLAVNSSELMKVLLTVRASAPVSQPIHRDGQGPLFVALVGDVSFSMDNRDNEAFSNLDAMKRAIAQLVTGPLTERTVHLAIYEFGDEVYKLTDGFVGLGTEEGRASAMAAVDVMGKEVSCRGGTNISAGAEAAIGDIAKAMDVSGQTRPTGVVILITDGQPNEGPYRGSWQGPELDTALRTLRGPRAITLATMALGTAPKRTYLEAFTTGPFAFAPTEKELPEAFELSTSALGAAAHNVTLKVRDESGVRSYPLGMVPRTGTEPLITVKTNLEGPAFDYALVVGDYELDVALHPEWFAWTPVELPRTATVECADRDGTMPEELEDAIAREAAAVEIARVVKRARNEGGRAAYDDLRALEQESASLGPRRQRTTTLVSSMVEQLGGRLLSHTSSFASAGEHTGPTSYDASGESDLLGLEAAQSMTSYSQSFA